MGVQQSGTDVLEWRVPGYRTVRDLRPRDSQGRSVLAVHEASGLPVALRYHAACSEALREGARALAGVSSPHIATLYEHIEVVLDGRFGVATVRSFVEGVSLARLPRLKPLPALAVLRAALLALSRAHAVGVTHGAVKPENLLVDGAGLVRLTDFSADRSDFPEDSESGPQSWILQDVRAAYGVFLTSIGGRLPRRLRSVAAAGESGDADALLTALSAAGQARWGADWPSRGAAELARLVPRKALAI